MNIHEAYPSRWLRAIDFPPRGTETFTIASVEQEELGGEEKVVLTFRETVKCWPLNKTNALRIAELHGDETDGWPGKTVSIHVEKVEYQGKRVPALRVVMDGVQDAERSAGAPQGTPRVERAVFKGVDSKEVPTPAGPRTRYGVKLDSGLVLGTWDERLAQTARGLAEGAFEGVVHYTEVPLAGGRVRLELTKIEDPPNEELARAGTPDEERARDDIPEEEIPF